MRGEVPWSDAVWPALTIHKPQGSLPAVMVVENRVQSIDERVFPARWPRMTTEALTVAVIAWGMVAFMYRLWDAPLRAPWAYTGDGIFLLAGAKSLAQGGWFYENPAVGAPYGQQMYDYPFGGETIQWAVLKFVSLFTDSPTLIVHFYYLSSFGVLAAIAFLVLRHLRFKTLTSALLALTYAFGAFHFVRGEGHIFLGVAYSVPLACLLLVWVSQWRVRFLKEHAPSVGTTWWANIRWPWALAALGICVFMAGWHSYYTIFTILLLTGAAILNAVRWRDWGQLVVAALIVTTLCLTLLAFLSPSLLYWQQHGNIAVAQRFVQEQELYGLEISRLFLPSDGSRIDILAKVGRLGQSSSPIGGEAGQSLGLVGSVGLIGLLYAALVGFRKRPDHTDEKVEGPYDRGALRQAVSTNTLLAILLGTVGGLGLIAAVFGLTQIRAWNRISPFILFFALIQVAIFSEQFSSWARTRLRGKYVGALLGAAAVLGTAVSAYAGPPTPVPDYPTVVALWDGDRAFLKEINKRMPPGSMVMQYPVLPFPEHGPLGGMTDYDPFRAYIADEGGLKWSYGAIKGRPESNWQSILSDPTSQSTELPAVLGLGFTGLWIDTYGYIGNESTLAKVRAELAPDDPLVSRDGRFLFYDLRPYKGRLGKTDADLRRLAELRLLTTASLDSGSTNGAERDENGKFWWIDSPTATIGLARNPAAIMKDQSNDGTALLALGLSGPPCGTKQTVTVTAPGGAKIVTEVVSGAVAEVLIPVTLHDSADTEITLHTDGDACRLAGDARTLLYSIRNVSNPQANPALVLARLIDGLSHRVP